MSMDVVRTIVSVLLRTDETGIGVAVLWFDRGGRLLDSFLVRATDDEVEEVAAPVIEVRGSPVGAVVLGSRLLEGRHRPGWAERRRFVELRERHAQVGVDLVDWFVLDHTGDLWSLAKEVMRWPDT